MDGKLLFRPWLRLAMAVAAVLLVRAVLRQPPPGDLLTTAPAGQRAATQQGDLAGAPRRQPASAASMDAIWSEVQQVFGARLAQAATSSNGAAYLSLWQEIGSFLRARGVTTAMFQQHMTRLGWSAEQQQQHLVASGYVWPPLRTNEGPEQYFRVELPLQPTDAPVSPTP